MKTMQQRRESTKRLETRARRIAAALQKLDADIRCSATVMRLALTPDEWRVTAALPGCVFPC